MAFTRNPLRSSHPDIRNLDDTQLIKQAFLQMAWGIDDLGRMRTLEEIELEVRYRSLDNPGLAPLVAESIKNGRLAHKLAAKYERKLQEEGNTEQVQAWLARETVHRHHSIAFHLNKCLDKWQDYQQQRQQRRYQRQTIDIPSISLNDQGIHPNSLRAIDPANEWDILIDEGGVRFNQLALEDTLDPHQIGRFVAIAIPNNKNLPPLQANQHAAGGDTAKQQQIVHNLLQSKVGVFGFAADDPVFNYRSYWMSHIHNLMRWVLILLPVESGAPCLVRFRIEQWGSYNADSDLTALREVLENEIKSLSPERYAELKIDLAIIKKEDHPANGYVDAIANLWSSPSGFKKKLLKHTHLLNNCLLNPKHFDSLERLYMSLSQQRSLQPEQWYQACTHLPHESQHSLLHTYLGFLGDKAKADTALWKSYLQHVSYRLASKQYRLNQLGSALDWLQEYAPEKQILPSLLELQLLAARLSLANHQGETQPEYLARSFQLIQQLQEENAPLACEALLRLAVSGTNAYQFDQVQPMIEQWLQLPIAVPGLLNHGKLHSTLGQLLAFQGKNERAVASFDRAFSCFARLSDPEQAAKEQLQTAGYHLCALMDLDDLSSSNRLQEALNRYLQQVTDQSDLMDQVDVLARSSDTLNRKFAHHLLLRALISWPKMLQPLRDRYLAQTQDWKRGDSHPWPLIQFYRGWLCLDDRHMEQASELMHEAVALCEQPDNGPTLHWMGAVLRQLATSLEVSGLELTSEQRNSLKQQLPLAPHQGLAQQPSVPLSWLHQVLPFNFH